MEWAAAKVGAAVGRAAASEAAAVELALVVDAVHSGTLDDKVSELASELVAARSAALENKATAFRSAVLATALSAALANAAQVKDAALEAAELERLARMAAEAEREAVVLAAAETAALQASALNAVLNAARAAAAEEKAAALVSMEQEKEDALAAAREAAEQEMLLQTRSPPTRLPPRRRRSWSAEHASAPNESAEHASAEGTERRSGSDDNAAVVASATGLLRNVPLARYRTVLLPHQQAIFDLFDSQLLHCFETLLTTAPPWRYVHVLLPSDNPAYALPRLTDGSCVEDGAVQGGGGKGDEGGGPLATLSTGTLTEIVWWSRLPDARLSLVCQGLGRAVVLCGTQDLPYPRADVLLLPDAEQIAAATRSLPGKCSTVGVTVGVAAEESIQLHTIRLNALLVSAEESIQLGRTDGAAERADVAVAFVATHAAVLARAVAEDACWRTYEFAPARLDCLGAGLAAFASFSPAAAAACARAAAELAPPSVLPSAPPSVPSSIDDGSARSPREAPTLTPLTNAKSISDEVAAIIALASDTARSGLPWRLARAVLAQGDGLAAAEPTEADASEALALVEVELWIELDAFLCALATQRGGSLPAPAQLLSLLPPPPHAGWPAAFMLSRAAEALIQKTEAFGVDIAEPFVRCDTQLYTARRRQQRLSFCVWTAIAQDPSQVQRALEATSTRERLEQASRRLRMLREELLAGGGPGFDQEYM